LCPNVNDPVWQLSILCHITVILPRGPQHTAARKRMCGS
jgi:hypothetical protein